MFFLAFVKIVVSVVRSCFPRLINILAFAFWTFNRRVAVNNFPALATVQASVFVCVHMFTFLKSHHLANRACGCMRCDPLPMENVPNIRVLALLQCVFFLARLPINGNVSTYNRAAKIKQITNKFILDISPFFFGIM